MGDLVPLRLTKRTIMRLAKAEIKRQHELYYISAGDCDPIPETDPEVIEMVKTGLIEQPWREI